MKFKRIMIILVIAVFLFTIASASAGDVNDTVVASEDTGEIELSSNDGIAEDILQTTQKNNTLIRANNEETVSSPADSQILGAGEGTYSDLRNDINNGEITKSLYRYVNGDGDSITITTNSKVIDGKGAIVDMVGSGIRALVVTANDVTIKNFTFKNAKFNGDGGAIYSYGSSSGVAYTIDIINCNFINNAVNKKGGAIYFDNKGSVDVVNCTFINNSAFEWGGAIMLDSGNVINCSFTNNKAGYGGAMYVSSQIITNCSFTNNSANAGGAIFVESISDYGVNNCSFIDNSADNYGGAIYFYCRSGHVSDSVFIGNNASDGSAIFFAEAGDNAISNSILLNNRANVEKDSPLNIIVNENNIVIEFKGRNNLLNAIYSYTYGAVSVTNVTYWGANGITNTGPSTIKPSRSNKEAGQNISVRVVVGYNVVLDEVKVTDENGMIVLDKIASDNYLISARHDEDSYYTEAESEIIVGAGTYSDLRNDINNGEITKSLYRYVDGDGDTIEITSSCVIDGKGAVVDMAGSGIRALKISSSEVTINNFTFKNAKFNGDGGAIYSYGSSSGVAYTIDIINCNFINNAVNKKGGAIYFDNKGSVDVVNCTFINNSAFEWGGAIMLDSGNVINCSFTNNKAGYGGAMYVSSQIITNCSFTNNSANAGGAIFVESISDYGVNNCSFIDNSADNYGGAIYFYCRSGHVSDSVFIGNNASDGSAIFFAEAGDNAISNSILLNNRANVEKDSPLNIIVNENNIVIEFKGRNNLLNAIYSYTYGAVSVTNVTYWGANGITNTGPSTIKPSRSNKEAGQNISVRVVVGYNVVLDEVKVTDENGMIVLDKIASDNYLISARHDEDSYYTEAESEIDVRIGTYSDLRNDIQNGGITKTFYHYVDGDGDSIRITTDSVVIDGKGAVVDMAGVDIRALTATANNVTIKNFTFKNVKNRLDGGAIWLESGSVENCNFINNSASSGGALIIISGSAVNCNFTANTAIMSAGALRIENGIVENCNFINNSASRYGGAVICGRYGSLPECILINCSFTDNFAPSGGAVNVLYPYSVKAINCNFTNNSATEKGGAFYLNYMSVAELINCNFENNKVTGDTGYGGAVYFRAGGNITNCDFTNNYASSDAAAVFFNDTGTISNCNFTNNKVRYDGGAIRFFKSGNVTNCNFVNNSASRDGGAIRMESGSIANCNFVNNSASRNGGAIYSQKYNGEVINCTFIDNYASQRGAVYFHDSATGTVINCTFINNTAKYGGAVYFYENGEAINCNFTNNHADHAGAVYFYESAGTVTNCNFDNNSADKSKGNGGAIFFGETTANVTNCNFTNNSAGSNGGAISFSAKGTVTNCNFADNSAGIGGAVYLYESIGTVTNCNFINNTATAEDNNKGGGAIYFDFDSNGVLINSTFIENTARRGGAVFIFDEGSVINCSFTSNSAAYFSGALFVGSGDVINCNFTNNSAVSNGGAVYLVEGGNMANCNFADNSAEEGGAIFSGGQSYTVKVTNCNFTDNFASESGGAVYFYSGAIVSDSVFIGNNATFGSAMSSVASSTGISISNSIFLNNRANADANTPLQVTINENNIEIIFTGRDNLINAISSPFDVSFSNVTYWSARGITNTDDLAPVRSKNEAGQNISVGVVVDDTVVFNDNMITDDEGKIVLDVKVTGKYLISVRHDEDSYYTEAEKILTNMELYANVTSVNTNNRTVNITAESNLYVGELLFILPNGDEVVAACDANGTWWAEYTFDEYGIYQVGALYSGLDNVIINNGTVNITKANSTLIVEDVVLFIGESVNLTVTTEGAIGITANINGTDVVVDNYTIPISGLAVGNYTLTVTTIPDEDHASVTKAASIIIHNLKYNVNVTSVNTNSRTVNITAESDIYEGRLRFILANGTEIDATNVANGTWWAEYTFDDYGVYQVSVAYDGLGDLTVNEGIINITKANSTLILEDVVLYLGESVNLTVTTEGATGITANINGTDVVVDNYTIPISGLAVGNYTLTVTTVPDGDHVSVTKTSSIIVKNLYLTVNVTSVDTHNRTVNITAKSNIYSGKLRFVLPDGKEVNATYATDGTWWAVHTFDYYGVYRVSAAYDGLGELTVNDGTVNITKANSTIMLENVELHVGESTDLTVETKGALGITAKINNDEVSVIDKFTIPIYNLTMGDYTLTVTTVPDEDHNAVTKTVKLTVGKYNTPLDIEIEFFNDTRKNVRIIAAVDPLTTGSIEFTVKDKTVSVPHNDEGIAVYELYLPVGEYTVNVNYPGDSMFNSKSKSESFTVKEPGKVDTSVIVIPFVEGNKVTIGLIVTEKDTTSVGEYIWGLLSGTGDNTIFETWFVDGVSTYALAEAGYGTPADVVNIIAGSLGAVVDGSVDTWDITTMAKGIASLWAGAYYGTAGSVGAVIAVDTVAWLFSDDDDSDIPKASGLATVEIDGIKYAVDIKDGEGMFTTTFAPGHYNAFAKYYGDEIYKPGTGSNTFDVVKPYKYNPKIVVVPTVNGTTVTLNITVSSNETSSVPSGNVTIGVLGQNFIVTLKNGTAVFTYDFNKGTYAADVTYLGNDKFNKATTNVSFTVQDIDIGLKNTTIGVDVEIIKKHVILTAYVDPLASGIIEFSLNGNTVYVPVKNGQAVFETKLDIGNYTADVTYLGDSRFNSNATNASFEVNYVKLNPEMDAVVEVKGSLVSINISVGVNSTGVIDLNETDLANATGLVNIGVSGQSFVVPVVDGNAVFTFDFIPGIYDAEIEYLGDENFNGASTAVKFIVNDPYKTDTVVNATPVVKGTVVTINIAVGVDGNSSEDVQFNITGNVTVEVLNQTFSLPVVDGKAVFTYEFEPGIYEANIIYEGDENFNPALTTVEFETSDIIKSDADIGIVIDVNGTNVTFHITVGSNASDENATGELLIDILGQTFNVTLENGSAVFSSDFVPGTYGADVVYPGDKFFNNASTAVSFTVLDNAPDLMNTTLDVDVSAADNNVTITATVNQTASGIIEFNIGGNVVYLAVTNGKAIYNTVLPAGDYNVNVTYLGDSRFNGNRSSANFTVVDFIKKNTTIESDIKVDGSDVVINVVVDENATGLVEFIINNNSTYSKVVDGVATLNMVLHPGDYSVTANYLGDGNFNNASTTASFTVAEPVVELENTTLNVDVTAIENDVTITAKVDSLAGGLVEFNIDDNTVYIAVDNGEAVYEVALPGGNYNVTVTYLGDEKFNPNSTTKSFTVLDHVKKDTAVNCEVVVNGSEVSVTAAVNESSATGFVEFNIAGKTYYIPVDNGKAVFVADFLEGTYMGNARYVGDENFNPSMTLIYIDVAGEKITLENTTIDIDVDVYENNVTISANVSANATGFVEFVVTGAENYTLYILVEDGKAVFEDVLSVGDYTVTATYLGDDKFNSNATSKSFTIVGHVKKYTVISAVPSVDGNTVTIETTVDENATGYVAISVLGQTFVVPVSDGKAVFTYDFTSGTYNSNVVYVGDDNFNNASTTASFTVTKHEVELKNTTISVDVNAVENDVTITAKVDSLASGLVEFNIDGQAVYIAVNNGEAVYTTNLPAGDYNVAVTYLGDDKFNPNSTAKSFTVLDHVKVDTAVSCDVAVNGSEVSITAVVNESAATGFVEFNIMGKSYYAPVANGKAVFVADFLAGTYMGNARYLGDDNFNPSMSLIYINVAEENITLKNTTIDVDVEVYDSNVTISAIVEPGATGFVEFVVTGAENYTLYILVEGGKAVFEDVLSVGDYTVTATYLGDNKFNGNATSESFTIAGHVRKDTVISAVPSVDGSTVTIEVTVDENATGYVAISVLGQTFVVPVSDGKAVFTYDFAPATYNSNVVYVGDDNFNNASTTASFTVIKQVVGLKNTTISVDVNAVENDVTITAKVDSLASGLVEFNINGNAVYIAVNNGEAVYEVVLPGGDYNVAVTYLGDDKFNPNSTSKSFTVSDHVKADTAVSCEVVVNGNEVSVTAVVNESAATGFVEFNIAGKTYYVPVANGKAIFVDDFLEGTYMGNARYIGDDNFNPSMSLIYINVAGENITLKNTTIDVNVDVYENNVTIIANVDSSATGFVEFVVTGAENYALYILVEDGKAVFEDVLSVGDYTVTATYLGDNKFNGNATSESFTIAGHVRKDTVISAVPSVDGSTVTIEVTVDENATGYVAISVLGQTFVVPVSDGKAVFTYDFAPATYNSNVVYVGDDNFNNASTTASFTVIKQVVGLKNTTISVDVNAVENDVTITAKVDSLASGLVEFNIDGNAVYIAVNNGEAVYTASLPGGDYNVAVTYLGDDKFNPNSTTMSFTVSDHVKADTKINCEVVVNGNEVSVTAVVNESAATGFVEFNIAGKIYYASIDNGKAVFVADFLAGTYMGNAKYLGDDNFNPSMTLIYIDVAEESITLENTTISADVEVVENIVKITVNVDESATGFVEIELNGSSIFAKVENGKAALETLLPNGNYTIKVTYLGDERFNSNTTSVSFAVKEKPVIIPISSEFSDVTVGDDLSIYIVLKDETGKVIANAPITYAVDGTAGTTTTAADGSFTIKAVNGAKVDIRYAGNETILPTNLTLTFDVPDVPVVVKTATHFDIPDRTITINGYAVDGPADEQGIYYATTLLDADGKPVSNVYMEFAVNNKIYNRTTYENGSFKPYKLNMIRAGRYTMAFNFAGDDNYTNAFACVCVDLDKKPITIKASAKTYKVATKTKKYTVTLSTIKGVDGKMHLSPKNVKLKVNGKTFTGKTNAKGQVTFKITNLKKKAKYKAVISYAGDKTYEAASKTVTLTVK